MGLLLERFDTDERLTVARRQAGLGSSVGSSVPRRADEGVEIVG